MLSFPPAQIQRKMTVGPGGDPFEQEADHVAKQVTGTASLPRIQRAVGPKGGAVDGKLESSLCNAKGGGQPLPSTLRTSMGNAFGRNFDQVQLHRDQRAGELNNALGYKATARRGQQDLEIAEMRAVGLEEYYDEDFIQGGIG